jgi:hypothetical protein
MLEREMRDLIAEFPKELLGEDLELIGKEITIGNYRLDLLFRDRHKARLIVEVQKGTLDRNHLYKILDYYDSYKESHSPKFVECMVIANDIPSERKARLHSRGISFREIPESKFLEVKEKYRRKYTMAPFEGNEDIRVEVDEEILPDSFETTGNEQGPTSKEIQEILGQLNEEVKEIQDLEGLEAWSSYFGSGEFYAIKYRPYFDELIKPNLRHIKVYLHPWLCDYFDFMENSESLNTFKAYYYERKKILTSLLDEIRADHSILPRIFGSIISILTSSLSYNVYVPTLEIVGGILADIYHGYHRVLCIDKDFLLGINPSKGQPYYRPYNRNYLEYDNGFDFIRTMPFIVALDGKLVNDLVSPEDELFVDRTDIREAPKIEKNWEVGEHLLNFGLENKRYAINAPSEVIINSGDIKTITFLDDAPHGCLFKVKYFDDKVSVGYIIYKTEDSKRRMYERFLYTDFYIQVAFGGLLRPTYSRAGDLYALTSAIIRDFYVCEEREKFYQKRDIPVSKKKKRRAEREQKAVSPRIQYLPRFRTRYIGLNENSFREQVVRIAPHPVRGHLRRCEHPSPIQIELAKRYGIKIDPGFTFVRPYFKGEYEKKLYRSRSALKIIYSC